MNRMILFLVTGMLLLAGCQKEDTTFNTDLGLDSRFIILNAPADTTKIVVYSDHNWAMENKDHVPWVIVQKGSGTGTAYAVVEVSANTDDYPRAATLVFRAGGKTDTLKLGQRGLVTPKIAITATSVASAAAGGTVSTVIDASLPLNKMSLSFSEGGHTWISDLAIVNNNLTFIVAPNTTDATRTAKIYLDYIDLLGTVARDSLSVNQAKP